VDGFITPYQSAKSKAKVVLLFDKYSCSRLCKWETKAKSPLFSRRENSGD